MELREGMYVRTKDGFIDKVINDYKGCCNSPNCNCKHVSCEHNYYDEENIIKVSDNLIDLIEVGDYVNGRLFHNELVWTTNYGWIGIEELEEKDIKSIVTKEQFNFVRYEVK